MPTERKILLALFAIALGLRVLYGAVLTTQTDIAPKPVAHELDYAREIVSGTRWIVEPFSPRSPGYPVVLAALYVLSLKQTWLITFLQAVLGALAVVVVYRMGRLFLDVPFATIATLWFAFHVHHMHYSYVFRREILVVLLFMLLLLLLVRPFVRMRYAVVSAIVYTGLIHVDPQFLVLLPVFAAFVFFKSRHRFLGIQYFFVFLGVILVASIPWTIRNYVVYDQPLPIGLEARRFLRPVKLVATEPVVGLADIETRIVKASRLGLIERNTVEFWRAARFRGGAESEAPASDNTRRRFAEPAWSARHNAVSMFNYGVLLPFFVLGIVFAIRTRERTALMLVTVVAVYSLMRMYLGGSEKTRLPIDPLIILIAFYGISVLARLLRREPGPRETPA